jgi:hypothetical protein
VEVTVDMVVVAMEWVATEVTEWVATVWVATEDMVAVTVATEWATVATDEVAMVVTEEA